MHDKIKADPRRQLPAVNKVLDTLDHVDLPRKVVVAVVRRELASLRASGDAIEFDDVFDRVIKALHRHRRSRLQPVINGTGIILHTNFGRAPLSEHARELIAQVAAGYSNLEFELETGQRGNRADYVESNLALLCQAEAATIVNNCAAALVLIVRHFTGGTSSVSSQKVARRSGNQIVISRGELVQIGGGFRIGEIIEAAGARLREVGATNKTTLSDYERAITPATAMILRAHRSNFFMDGFVDAPSVTELASLARKKRRPLIVDLGSGLIEQVDALPDEVTPIDTLREGADLVCFSGDKLFGGPQCGIIVGRKRLVNRLKQHPLFRALRCDKLTIAALQATVDLHLADSLGKIPALALIKADKDELRARAAHIVTRLRGLPAVVSLGRGTVKSGGGTSPRAVIPSVTIDLEPNDCTPNEFAARLRGQTPPVIGYIAQGVFKLDLRTVLSSQDDAIVDAIRSACSGELPVVP